MNKLFLAVGSMGAMFAAQGRGIPRPDVPDNLKAPAGEEVILVGRATAFMTSDHPKYCLLRRFFLRARQGSKYSKVIDHRSIAASLVGLLIWT